MGGYGLYFPSVCCAVVCRVVELPHATPCGGSNVHASLPSRRHLPALCPPPRACVQPPCTLTVWPTSRALRAALTLTAQWVRGWWVPAAEAGWQGGKALSGLCRI